MADAIVIDGTSVDNSLSSLLNTTAFTSTARDYPGLVHALVAPDIQVKILAAVDETGTAELEDIIAALGDHAQPVAAVMVLVGAGMLEIERDRVLDAHSRLRRPGRADPDAQAPSCVPIAENDGKTEPPAAVCVALPAGITTVPSAPHSPEVYLIEGTDRLSAGDVSDLHRPGVYAAFWGPEVYVGMSGDVARRIAAKGHLSTPHVPDIIIAIIDRHDELTPALARVAERALAMAVAVTPGLQLLNAMPDGDVIGQVDYAWIRLFVSEAALMLRQAGIAFSAGNTRDVLSGPHAEAGRLGDLRMDDLPPGEVFELQSCGVTAWAVEGSTRWTLLKGSEARAEVMPSANSSASLLRSEWLHSGILIPFGDQLRLARDVCFSTGSAAAHFVTGSKAIGRAGWKPIGDRPVLDPAI